MNKANQYRIEFLYRPGRYLDDARLGRLVGHLRAVADDALDDAPRYQCLSGERAILAQNVIAVAWTRGAAATDDWRCAGFCSALLLDMDEVGEVLHLGLTCVTQADRGARLTHKLTSTVLIRTLLRRPLDRVWVSNVACVLSSLGNVALHFDDVHPSPFFSRPPSWRHRRIAGQIASRHRAEICISPDAVFDAEHFVMRGSNATDSVFLKGESDVRYHHREAVLNQFYQGLLRFEDGDEVIQVGHASLWGMVQYGARQLLRPGTRRSRIQALGA